MTLDQLKYKLISNGEIIFLKELDNKIITNNKIIINKKGKFSFFILPELTINNTIQFISELKDNKVYSLFPLISANNKTNEPYIILSQSILITNKSNPLLFNRFIWNKCSETSKLYNIPEYTEFNIILKYKPVEIIFKPYNDNNFLN